MQTNVRVILNGVGFRIMRLRGDGAWAISDQFMVSAFSFIIGIVIARMLGVAEFGKVALILLLAAQAQTLQDCMLAAPMMTLVGRRAKRTASYFGAVVGWGLILSFTGGLVVATLVALLFLLRDGSVSYLLCFAALAMTASQSLHSTARRLLFAQRRRQLAMLADFGRYASLLLAVLLLRLGPEAARENAVVVLITMAGCALMGPLTYLFSTERPRVSWRLMQKVILRHWPIAQWLILMIVASIGQEQIVPIIITFTLGDAALGGLRAGQYLVGSTHFILMAVSNYVPRRAAEAYAAGGSSQLSQYLSREMLVLGLPTVFLLLTLGIYAEFLLGKLFGSEYIQFAPILRVYCLSYTVIFVRDFWMYYLTSIEQTRATFEAFMLSSIFTVLSAYPAIRHEGILGAALVVLAANLISCAYILLAVCRQHHHLKFRASSLDQNA